MHQSYSFLFRLSGVSSVGVCLALRLPDTSLKKKKGFELTFFKMKGFLWSLEFRGVFFFFWGVGGSCVCLF